MNLSTVVLVLTLSAGEAISREPHIVDSLASGDPAPDLVAVPAGRFLMGSNENEVARHKDESPQHIVNISAFALGRTEVTRAQFARFIQATKYRTDAERSEAVDGMPSVTGCFGADNESVKTFGWIPERSWRDPGFDQADDHPVTCISWNDARAYLEWLSHETRQSYRLPTEAEQEYSIRAGSMHPFPWGESPDDACTTSNVADISSKAEIRKRFGIGFSLLYAASNCDDGFPYTASVAHLTPNAFGLYDTVGNVLEWSQDCYNGSYANAPKDGSTVVEGEICHFRVLRGAAYSDDSRYTRSASRLAMRPMYRYHNVGFRVARNIEPAPAK